jgi:hypothetical protein
MRAQTQLGLIRKIALCAIFSVAGWITVLPANAQVTGQCRTFGTAPFCKGSCPANWIQKNRTSKSCISGSKAVCCEIVGPKAAPPPGQVCRLFGKAPFCAANRSDCPRGWFYKGDRNANCTTGHKVECCNTF